MGPAVAVGDIDQDGLLDLVVGAGTAPLAAFRNLGGLAFENSTAAWNLEDRFASALALVDLDADGRNELILAGSRGLYLLWNDGARFRDVTEASGLTDKNVEAARHILVADFDRDGLLDVHLSGSSHNRVLRALGGGAYEDVTELWGWTTSEVTWSASWFAQDRNGTMGLFLATDTQVPDLGAAAEWSEELRGDGDRLYRTSQWTDAGEPAWLEVSSTVRLDVPRSSMGGLIGDLDHDLRLDIFVSDYGRNHAISGQPDGSFRYRTAELGLDGFQRSDLEGCPTRQRSAEELDRCMLVSWGAALVDFDHDGWSDLVVVNGGLWPDARGPQPLSLYRGTGDRFEEVESRRAVHGRALAPADLDNDGDIDLIIAEWNGTPLLLENVATGGSWLAVQLRDNYGNTHVPGAVLTVESSEGTYRRIPVGAGGLAQANASTLVHVGLGFSDVVAIEVLWPSGYVQRVPNPPTASVVLIQEPPLVNVSQRVAPADGLTGIEIVVQPHDQNAVPLGPGRDVRIRRVDRTTGELAVSDLGDGRYVAVLAPSAVASTAVLQVEVDGSLLTVRPRVRFE